MFKEQNSYKIYEYKIINNMQFNNQYLKIDDRTYYFSLLSVFLIGSVVGILNYSFLLTVISYLVVELFFYYELKSMITIPINYIKFRTLEFVIYMVGWYLGNIVSKGYFKSVSEFGNGFRLYKSC